MTEYTGPENGGGYASIALIKTVVTVLLTRAADNKFNPEIPIST